MKKLVTSILVFLLFVIICFPTLEIIIAQAENAPEIQWSKTYGGEHYDGAFSFFHTNDDGYALVGVTFPGGGLGCDIWVVKVDSTGSLQWNKTYGGLGSDVGVSIIQTNDSGYAILGTSNSYGEGIGDCLLIKTDSNGNQQWSKTYGNTGSDNPACVIQTIDGGYAIAAWTLTNSETGDSWLIKTDSNGNQQWKKNLGRAEYDIFSSMVQTNDGGYAIAGSIEIYENNFDFWLVKTDSQGNQQWEKTFGTTSRDYANSLIQTSDDGYLVVGTKRPYNERDFWLVKTDSEGNQQWEKTIGGAKDDIANSVIQCDDGGYAIVGDSRSVGAGDFDFWLVKTDSQGNQQWEKSSGGLNDEEGNDLVQTNDGGYAICGLTFSYGSGDADFYLIKIPYQSLPSFSFNVVSDYGDPTPSVGVHVYDSGSLVTASVNSFVTIGDTVWTCTGWSGTGSVPSSGSTTSVSFAITQDSAIIWNWHGTRASDLIISDIFWEPNTPSVGDQVIFSYTIKNNGGYASDFSSAVYIDGERFDVSSRKALGGGETEKRSISYPWTAVEGSHNVKVRIDYLNEVNEENENNNEFDKIIVVANAIVLAEITSFDVDYGTFFTGETVRALVNIRNTGDVSWTYYVGYSIRDSADNWWDAPYETMALDPGDSDSMYLYWNVPIGVQDGDCDVRVAVWKGSSGGLLQERLDMKEKQDAFKTYAPTMEKTYKIHVNVWLSGSVSEEILVSIFDDNGNLVNQQSTRQLTSPAGFDFYISSSLSGEKYRIETTVIYRSETFPNGIPASTEAVFILDADKTINLYPALYPIPEPNTVVTLQESQDKLFLHLYDLLGNQIGMNHETGRLKNSISVAHYFDFLNGTIMISLPGNITDFNYVVDATHAKYQSETYNVTLLIFENGEQITSTFQEGTIEKSEKTEIPVLISFDDKTITFEKSNNNSNLTYFLVAALIVVSIIVGVAIYLLKRKNKRLQITEP